MIITHIYRLKAFLRPLVAIALMAVCGPTWAQTAYSADSLRMELAKATTPADSVAILHNLYDCYYFDDRKPIIYQIFETAEHAKDYTSMLETLFLLASIYQHVPAMEEELLTMAKRVPESEMRRLHELFIELQFQAASLSRASEEERQQRLNQALKDYSQPNGMKYNRIACLFLICTNLRNTTDSELLVSYLQQLQEMVEESPKEELPIRTLFYTLAINAYIENGMYDKALAANKRMLELIGQFDKLHESQGRIFRKYDGSLYQAYHNMLVCADELTDEEVDMYYDRILHLAAINPRIHSDIAQQNRSRIYYLMAKKRYAEALPLLKEQLGENISRGQYYNFATRLVKAARAVGDKDALLQGAKALNSIHRERLQAKSDVRLSELQTIYDVNNLKGLNRNLNQANRLMEIDRRKQDFIAVTVAMVLLIGVLVWMTSLYLHSRRLARQLSASNKKLVEERNSIKAISAELVDVLDKVKEADQVKNDFVDNMSDEIREPLSAIVEYSRLIADYAREYEKSNINEYADAMTINTDLLIRIVNDILDLPQIESGELSIHKKPASANGICEVALGLVKKHVAPDVEIIFANKGQKDTSIVTDPQRVEQVLLQILSNAAKFTESGSITLGYKVDKAQGTITFAVTDTGIGIPQGMEEKIFDRFVKIDPTAQGNGLGLYIGRLLANMLGGSLTLDSHYITGCRFLFTIPIA